MTDASPHGLCEHDEIEQFRLAVYGPYEVEKHTHIDTPTLIYRAGYLRREVEDAHSHLDTLGVPRRDKPGNTLTLLGRISLLAVEL